MHSAALHLLVLMLLLLHGLIAQSFDRAREHMVLLRGLRMTLLFIIGHGALPIPIIVLHLALTIVIHVDVASGHRSSELQLALQDEL